ncbi:AbrB/MazE/SpoVT family DNA-binding domain-containing protein [Staphylothermus hellenicus]|uniref:Transcriptional regulator, AbrB family n=1 Tax=Staphylothermus hellenicus (strain DSM 12710 / JCM 10830 / BK20S6-10-b1 / P8) TaxID=591019 RepID=D7D8C0_STAHD|nr:AbrB/MazE/SpoVT family DNA-binding domain-containing protein [Staphylothermus hellenicus]ADI32016.1 transcriptional regulator, AbrB family [Staphylothermus hellenicus DSM 12710]
MSVVVRVDSKGRIVIPKNIREALGIREKQLLMLRIVDGKIVLEPIGDVADKYYGVVRVEKWPSDLDEFLAGAVREWWRRST